MISAEAANYNVIARVAVHGVIPANGELDGFHRVKRREVRVRIVNEHAVVSDQDVVIAIAVNRVVSFATQEAVLASAPMHDVIAAGADRGGLNLLHIACMQKAKGAGAGWCRNTSSGEPSNLGLQRNDPMITERD